jgi:NADP-dependent 3-hydroxy acid dehydrogenase YdfG
MDKQPGRSRQWRLRLKACRIGPKNWKRNQKGIVVKIIVITGASSGFGGLTARALAKAGHTVYASMRDTTGQNARQVEEAKKFAKDNKVDLRSIELDVTSQASVDRCDSEDCH